MWASRKRNSRNTSLGTLSNGRTLEMGLIVERVSDSAQARSSSDMDTQQDGVALIAVLWLLVLLSLVAAVLSLDSRSEIHVARNMADHDAARAAADAGIQRAVLGLATM